jgi:hypothetical protein
VLRVLSPAGVPSRDVPGRCGVSKEAVAMATGLLVRGRLATEGREPGGGRWRIARLTARGAAAQGRYHELVAETEDAWRARFGGPALDALRASLERLPARLLIEGTDPYPGGWRARLPPPGVLPHYPMVLHRGAYPDGS